ncbi:MAG: Gfo/Idh/MocA family oxidoreductase [Bryobacteraceae bacterium]|nr:Gfo/Idh/MocA family oxidoreductase [Bryobacteraceae bacterium]
MGIITRRNWLAGAAAAALAAQESENLLRLPRKIRVGLIGLVGHPNEIIGPLPLLPDVEVAAIADPDEAGVKRMMRNPRLAKARHYSDYRRMLDTEKLDVVAVCNDNGARAAAVIAAAQHKFHVIAEKPLATNRKDFEAVRREVERQNVGLGMLVPMRYSPVFAAMKRIVDSGEIGEVAQIDSQKSYRTTSWPEWKSRRSSYGSTILWIGPHSVDLIRFTSGREITSAFSRQAHIGAPELGDAENATATLFGLDNGGVAVMRLDYLRPDTAPSHEDDRLRLAGTKGVLEFQKSTGLTLMTKNRKPEVVTDLPKPRPLFVDFLDHLYNGRPEGVSRKDIYRINEIVLAADESARNGKLVPA